MKVEKKSVISSHSTGRGRLGGICLAYSAGLKHFWGFAFGSNMMWFSSPSRSPPLSLLGRSLEPFWLKQMQLRSCRSREFSGASTAVTYCTSPGWRTGERVMITFPVMHFTFPSSSTIQKIWSSRKPVLSEAIGSIRLSARAALVRLAC